MQTKYLIVLALGLAGFAAEASAQYYPPPGPYSTPGPYRGAPLDDDDDDLGPPGMVGPPGASPRISGPAPYEVQPLPPPGTYAQPAVPPAPPRDSYAYPPAERAPAGPRPYATGSNPGSEQPVRPPGDISGSGPRANPPYAPYAPPGAGRASPPDGPTGAVGARGASPGGNAYASLPPDYRPEEGKPKDLSPHLQRQVVTYPTPEPAGTIIIDTPNTFLYLVLGDGKAMRYGIGVGREGFTWSGVERISKMAEWPDWHPPKEMIDRQPYLPRFMAGGESNPLGARALYLGKSVYRIHGTNQPSTIGTFVSSGCIRLTNGDVEDLFRRVNVGTRVVVLAGKPNHGQPPGPGNAEIPSSSQVIR
ncbi:MAG: L,D-transpeptidase family protein [Rhodoplanes sp.]